MTANSGPSETSCAVCCFEAPMPDLHAIVLTLSEEIHIARCLKSIRDVCATITVVDSGSTDRTVEIAKSFGAEVVSNPWVNHATQMNFAIDHVASRGGWLLRIDADELLSSSSAVSLVKSIAQANTATAGILLRRRIFFMGRGLRWGGMDPIWQLRVWREGRGRCEIRWMDEHIIVSGETEKSRAIMEDRNENSIDWWTAKHNSYASLEAIDLLNLKHRLRLSDTVPTCPSSPQAAMKRAIKEGIYVRLPGPLRTWLYFFYRYLLLLGFLDGKPGFYFHVLQGLWYRTLVDAKVCDIEAFASVANTPLVEAIRIRTGIDLKRNLSKPITTQSATD
jgi:glycosyltransferase involved in cell wall biosynthesis